MEKWRLICKLIYIINIVLEIAGVWATYQTLDSHCVFGGEISLSVMFFLLFMPFAVIMDLLFALLVFILKNLGTDPVAIVYNLLSGVLCLGAGIPAIMVMASLCGNTSQISFVSGGILAVVSGVFHIINAVILNIKMQRSERYWPTKKSAKKNFKDTSDAESGEKSIRSAKSDKSSESENSSNESSKSSMSNRSSKSHVSVENGGKIKEK